MRRGIALAVVLALMLGAVAWAMVSPPKLLSFIDRIAGGGRGTERAATAVPFGTHGQTLDVWVPAQPSNVKRPVLIWWYGGGWVKGDRDAYAFAGRAFARAGFVVVIPDYRKVPTVRFPAFLQDGAEAVAWTRDHAAEYGGDPRRIAFAGHSAGAYTATMLALDPRWLRGAGVDPNIAQAVVGLAGPYDFYPFTTRRSIDAMGQAPDPLATQPIRFARADAPPMLLATSDADTVVRARNANNLAARLRELGAPVEVINYGSLSHEEVVMALARPFRGRGPVLRDSVAFLRGALHGNTGRTRVSEERSTVP